MQKHAYLILAHNNFYILEKLLRLLDDSRNDIFIHIDKKAKEFNFDYYSNICREATVFFTSKRLSADWGSQKLVLAELLLFKTAQQKGPYLYYHLSSGVDLPLKTQNQIHSFFENKNEEFIYYHENPTMYDIQRLSRYHNVFGNKSKLSMRLNQYFYRLQEKCNVDRLKGKAFIFKRGYQWASLTSSAVSKIVEEEDFIKKLTRYTSCADELYKQIILLNHGYTVFLNKNKKPENLRFVDWSAGGNHPHVFTVDDYDRLIASDKLFARKFDEKVDLEIVDKLYDYIMSKQEAEKYENRNRNNL